MNEEKKYEIAIPDECPYTGLIQCLVDPPYDKMSVTFTLEGEDEPFRGGKITNRRCPEVSGFMFRPMKLNKKLKKRDEPLKEGDTVIVKVTLFKKSNPSKNTLSEPFQDESNKVKITKQLGT